MLVRDDDLGGGNGLALFILHGDLALGIRAQTLLAIVAGFGQKLQDALRIIKWRRHQVRGFIAGIAKHDALVASTLFLVGAVIDTLSNVG